jgi:uncharacterized damage-inducible protein DinB
MSNPRRAFLLTPPDAPLPAGLAFLRQARFRLREDYRVKIGGALEALSEEQVWWRPNPASNSIGNLLLHLAGNLRQWVISGVGGALDVRDRPREFAARETIGKAALLALLDAALEEADAVMAGLESELAAAPSDEALQRERRIQGFPQTVLDALFHAVEHFSFHTGQIVYIAKLHTAEGMKFYDDRQLAGQR